MSERYRSHLSGFVVVITTTKPDKWDRYLSDIYLTLDGADVFLNNRLLELGHARRYDDVTPADWDTPAQR